MPAYIAGILYGVVGSAVLAGSTYLKANKLEEFNWGKFLPTVVIGGITGGVASLGMDPNIVVTPTISASVALVVENIVKMITRRRLYKAEWKTK